MEPQKTKHTNTKTQTQTQTHTRTHLITQRRKHKHKATNAKTQTHTTTQTHKHKNASTKTQIHKHKPTKEHKQTHKQENTNTQTQKHKHKNTKAQTKIYKHKNIQTDIDILTQTSKEHLHMWDAYLLGIGASFFRARVWSSFFPPNTWPCLLATANYLQGTINRLAFLLTTAPHNRHEWPVWPGIAVHHDYDAYVFPKGVVKVGRLAGDALLCLLGTGKVWCPSVWWMQIGKSCPLFRQVDAICCSEKNQGHPDISRLALWSGVNLAQTFLNHCGTRVAVGVFRCLAGKPRVKEHWYWCKPHGGNIQGKSLSDFLLKKRSTILHIFDQGTTDYKYPQ